MRIRDHQMDTLKMEVDRLTSELAVIVQSRAALLDSVCDKTIKKDGDANEKMNDPEKVKALQVLKQDLDKLSVELACALKQSSVELLKSVGDESTSCSDLKSDSAKTEDECGIDKTDDDIPWPKSYDVKLREWMKTLKRNVPVRQDKVLATAVETPSSEVFNPSTPLPLLPPQNFLGKWGETWAVGMKVLLQTSTRDYLLATITNKSLQRGTYDLILDNGDTVRNVFATLLHSTEDTSLKRGVAPVRTSAPASAHDLSVQAAGAVAAQEKQNAALTIVIVLLLFIIAFLFLVLIQLPRK